MISWFSYLSLLQKHGGQVGGIARTVNYKGYLLDIGGQRFFTKWSLSASRTTAGTPSFESSEEAVRPAGLAPMITQAFPIVRWTICTYSTRLSATAWVKCMSFIRCEIDGRRGPLRIELPPRALLPCFFCVYDYLVGIAVLGTVPAFGLAILF